nr:V-type proton ATPase subunit G3-like isoform X2 [Quercus suber]XP_023880751.1 V-type proton ATPase subunit G3-like isoform X2 [Quercus suber]
MFGSTMVDFLDIFPFERLPRELVICNFLFIQACIIAMDPFRGQGGIQMLLTAEQEAQSIVASAKSLKMGRLKQAKDEADREATLYRSHMEAEYQKTISETSGSSGSNAKRLEEETDLKIQNLKKSAARVSSDIVGMLIKYATTVPT